MRAPVAAWTLALLGLVGLPTLVVTQAPETSVQVLQVRDHIYMLVSPEANVTMQVGGQGVLLVDTGGVAAGAQLMTAIHQVTPQPVRVIINTSADTNIAGGNEAVVSHSGGPHLTPESGGRGIDVGAAIISHENTYNRLLAAKMKEEALPTDTFFGEYKNVYFNDEGIKILYQPKAHADGDVLVYFRRSDVISAGSVLDTTRYPVIDLEHGGTIQGTLDALNHILDITVPERNEQGGTLVIPAHGRLCNQTDVTEIRNALTTVRNRIQQMASKGMSLDQIRAARPTLDYDGAYGSPDAFIEAVYKTLQATHK